MKNEKTIEKQAEEILQNTIAEELIKVGYFDQMEKLGAIPVGKWIEAGIKGIGAAGKGAGKGIWAGTKWPEKALVLELSRSSFIDRRENVIFIGSYGTGKTHLAISLAVCACRQGKKVRFYTAAGLINDLLEAQSQLRLGKLESALAKCDLIILDEMGFVPFTKEGAEALFTFCASRYERGSLIITTNLDFARWKEIFGDDALTGALLDRLTHRCHILEMNGDSYRFKESLKRKKKDVN